MQGLTQVEEMLIARVLPIFSIYSLPYGQYGYSGQIHRILYHLLIAYQDVRLLLI